MLKPRITLHQIRHYGYHGVYQAEKEKGNWFRVNLSFSLRNDEACVSDNLEHTVDYSVVTAKVIEEMTQPSELLEHLARRILDRVALDFEMIEDVEVEVFKEKPPMDAEVASVSVRLRG